MNCQNGSDCDVVGEEAVCYCQEGYEGDTCELLIRDRFFGTYEGSGGEDCNLGPATIEPLPDISVTVVADLEDHIRMSFNYDGYTLTARTFASGYFIIDTYVLAFENSYSGNGHLIGDTLELDIRRKEPGLETCYHRYILEKQN